MANETSSGHVSPERITHSLRKSTCREDPRESECTSNSSAGQACNREVGARHFPRSPTPLLFSAAPGGAPGSSLAIARRLEKGDPRIPVHYVARALYVFGGQREP